MPGFSPGLYVWGVGKGEGKQVKAARGAPILLGKILQDRRRCPVAVRRDARMRERPGNSSGDRACPLGGHGVGTTPPPYPRSSNKGKGYDGTLPLCLRLLLNLCSFGRLNLSAWFIEAAAWTVSRTK